jgi:hypothetical protein
VCTYVLFINSGTRKKLEKLAKEKECDDIHPWKKSIINHMYWAAGSTPGNDGDVIVAKWESVVHHVQNIHDQHPNQRFSACLHGPLDDIAWLDPSKVKNNKLGI